MPLSRAVRVALAAERKEIVRRQRRDGERLAAIELLLGGEDDEAAPKKRKYTKRAKRREPETVTLPISGKPFKFRDTLRALLEDGSHKKPAEVIQLLRDGGIKLGGTTPMETRVYNELKRMRREGELERDDRGRYALKAS